MFPGSCHVTFAMDESLHLLNQVVVQAAEANLESAQSELAQARQQGDSELTRLGSEYDSVKESLDTLEVSVRVFIVLNCCQSGRETCLFDLSSIRMLDRANQ